MDRKNAWTTYSREELDKLEQVNTAYSLSPAFTSPPFLMTSLISLYPSAFAFSTASVTHSRSVFPASRHKV